jgi:hypothetical protein
VAVNLWARWRELTAADPLVVADVLATDSGRLLVEYPGGARSWVIGAGTVGGRVFIRGQQVIGDAPALDLVVDTI